MVGLTTAASGLTADERIQQLLSNNLANANTPGFKASLAESVETPVKNIYRGPYGGGLGTYVGAMGSGVAFQEGVPNFSGGTVQQTGRQLDVAISDALPSGPYAQVQGTGGQAVAKQGTVTVGNAGRLTVGGQPLSVFDANGQAALGVYAVKNPSYQGTALTGAAGLPDYDASGNPSYVFANAAGKVVNVPSAVGSGNPYAIRTGTQDDMGRHSFYPVDYTSRQGATGIALTKDGALQLDANNNLVDSTGNPILPIGANGQVIAGGRITMNRAYAGSTIFQSNGSAQVDAQGQPAFRVYNANGTVDPAGRLGTVDADVTQLSPLGATEFMVGTSLTAASVTPLLSQGTGKMTPGSLEQSNADSTSDITKMMSVSDAYQATAKVVQTEDSMLNTAVNQIGKVSGA